MVYSPQELPQPKVVIGTGVDSNVEVDPAVLAQVMQELGISDQGIKDATIYMDPNNRFQVFGTHYPNKIGRLRLHHVPEIQDAQGDIIGISTRVKGKDRPEYKMNNTLVHELEHLAQQDRHDNKLHTGHLAIWGLAAVGAVLGNRLGKKSGNIVARTIAPVVGFGLGHQIGYVLAPHERQARQRAREVSTQAITQRK